MQTRGVEKRAGFARDCWESGESNVGENENCCENIPVQAGDSPSFSSLLLCPFPLSSCPLSLPLLMLWHQGSARRIWVMGEPACSRHSKGPKTTQADLACSLSFGGKERVCVTSRDRKYMFSRNVIFHLREIFLNELNWMLFWFFYLGASSPYCWLTG